MLRCWSALTTVPCLGAAQVVAGVPDGRSVWWRLITCGGSSTTAPATIAETSSSTPNQPTQLPCRCGTGQAQAA